MIVKEGLVEFNISSETKLTKKMSVFYNPVMSFQRDLNIALLKALNNKNLIMADILAGSGVRSLRFLKELDCVDSIFVNDGNPQAFKIIKKNIKDKRAIITNKNANATLYDFPVFDYIDIDPFGSPNPFLDASIQRLKLNGVLAITATDTAALCGTYVKACKRKYLSVPLRNELMHEIGIRILIRKVQLIGAQYDKAFIPVFSHSTRHYMRVYFKHSRKKSDVDELFKNHQFFHYCNFCMNHFVSMNEKEECCKDMLTAGPVWTGNLWEDNLVEKMIEYSEHKFFLKTILGESKMNTIGFYDMHKFASKLKISPPKKELLLKHGVSTHFTPTGIKTKLSVKEFMKLFKKK